MRSSAPYVTSHADLLTHEKLLDLCGLLEVSRVQAIGHLHALWYWCALNSPTTGKIPDSNDDLAGVMLWDGDSGTLYRGLVAAGWINPAVEGVYAHEWCVYGGDRQAAARKSDHDRKRLARLRHEEQHSLLPDPSSNELSESVKVHMVLFGDDQPVIQVRLQRIERGIGEYPRVNPVDVALDYVNWQLQVAASYRESRKGTKPHTDPVRGWLNQMRMHTGRGQNLRVDDGSPLVDFDDKDIQDYHRRKKAPRQCPTSPSNNSTTSKPSKQC